MSASTVMVSDSYSDYYSECYNDCYSDCYSDWDSNGDFASNVDIALLSGQQYLTMCHLASKQRPIVIDSQIAKIRRMPTPD